MEEKSLKKIGRALETYIKLSKDHAAMMARERADFELGRRHLANMMNLDAHTMTQDDIDAAICYLFPSGLFDLKARPVMRPPDEIMPKFRSLSFDEEGRPKDSRFFTLHPKFYKLLSYAHLLMAFDYLISLPSSAVEEKFIMQYREPLAASTKSKLFGPAVPEVKVCPKTQRRVATVRTRCKDTMVSVKVSDAGTGKFDIDGLALHDFRHLVAR
ncbi:unnamed protein product [Haemonchus placei]|uniref:DNA helicase n=1 Tax=Haemonchus placei TaxID=6290 RepID=A0A0N4X0B0_HAEPC|nr:unnamed protein product [Haemonchus placei]